MKRLLYISILLFSSFGFAQENNLERAKKYFNRTYYSEAIPLYEKLVAENRSQEVIQNLGDCYYFINDLKSAQRYYRFLIKHYGKDLSEEYYFRFSESLKATANYAEANQVLIDYYTKRGKSTELALFEKDLKLLENIIAIGERFKIKNLEINTDKSEFGAVIYNDQLVYAAAKNQTGFLDKIYKWNNESYLNLVSVPLSNIHAKDSTVHYFAKELKSPMHEATPVFTADGKTMYFTKNYTKKNGKRAKNSQEISVLHIYRAQLVDGKWDKITSLPINNPNYSTAHPALSPDEKTLYFSSDMPGSKGSFDIYSVEINEGLFGIPKNLGDQINTTRREQFPFVSKDNKLYFSSNGHIGFGALDIYVSNITNENFSKPINVGLPINSGVDDFAFNINSNTKEGFFSTNRKGGKGGDDLYSLSEIKPLIIEDCKQYITGIITDINTALPLEGARLVLYDLIEKKDIEAISTDAYGKFKFTVACEKEYIVKASKEGYLEEKRSLLIQKERNKENDASMKLKSLVKLQEEQTLVEEAKKKAEEEAKEKEKVIAEEKKKEKLKEILAKEKDIVAQKDKLVIKTDPIYFDYDLWYIRRDSKPVLDKVIDLMKKYPDMVVEIGSHTDIRGGKTYNLILSENRATSTKDYFIDRGIDAKRIIAKGYGESQPVIKCPTEESCTEEEHELNRRSEFVIKDL
ncbi:PD40 domain-containing protein [Flavobacterium oreochromis]|uniref:OmpA family protein n=1 Tax=Flavobacterium oreochromis TaxID=2906078 RepID=UPI001CE6E9F9|nr:OmpA family protein [Flavobacterium oreochromis]QYS86169.1 PD40 domain-containing protein [Flavobacterium oreochromis]